MKQNSKNHVFLKRTGGHGHIDQIMIQQEKEKETNLEREKKKGAN
jgi:hypothetical protein